MADAVVPVGIKETKEACLGLITIAAALVKEMKDQGFQAADLVKAAESIMADPVKKQRVSDAYNGASQIIGEVKDISLAEGLELAMAIVPEVIAAVKG